MILEEVHNLVGVLNGGGNTILFHPLAVLGEVSPLLPFLSLFFLNNFSYGLMTEE